MQKTSNRLLILAAACAVGAASTAAYGASTVYEPFDYANGLLEGNTNNTAPSTVTVNTTTFTNTNVWTHGGTHIAQSVVSGDLTYAGLTTTTTSHMGQINGSGGNFTDLDRIAIGSYPQDSTVYFSMLVQVPSSVTTDFGATGAGSFFAGFQFNPTTISASTDMNDASSGSGGALCVHSNGTGYSIGIAYRDLAGARVFDDADVLTAGQTVLVAGKLQLKTGDNNDVATLYINPDPLTEPATGSAVSDSASIGTVHDYFYSNTSGALLDTQIRSFFLRNNGSEPGLMNVDEIRIGDSWAAVTATPEPASLSLLGLGALGLLSRRRRTA